MTAWSSRRHLDAEAALGYLEGTLPARGRRAVEEHLASPCPGCRERLHALARLLAHMRADRTPAVSDALRARALAAFTPAAPAAPLRRLAESLARLVFDSWAAPLPAAARRAVGEARRLRWALAAGSLEIECEREAAESITLRGRLEAPEAALYAIEVRAGAERREVRVDADGSFALEGLPDAPLEIAVVGPERVDRIPRLDPER